MSELDRLVARLDQALQTYGPDRAWSLSRAEVDVQDVVRLEGGIEHRPARREWRWRIELNGNACVGMADGKTPEEAFRKATDALIADAQHVVRRREDQAKGARDRLAALLRAIEQP